MAQPDVDIRHTIGKRINRDIFSDRGVLLIPESSIINLEHLRMLRQHDITLTSRDLSPDDPQATTSISPHEIMIDEAVLQAEQLFDEVRETQKIPLADIRNNVIPILQEAAQSAHWLDLVSSLQAKGDYTYRHHIAVGAIANILGTWLELDRQELLQLTTAALLHDVGKMLIPEHILNKPGKLTDEEYAQMKRHTVLGYEILRITVGINHRQALVALHHHERMDGSGYPFGLTGDKIDLFSRIVAVADVFHAMTSARIYRNPSPFYEVLYQMERDTFGPLDPVITRLFIEKIMTGLIGHSVLLTDGSEGTIVMIHRHDPIHPLVQRENQFLDLSKDLSIHIKQIL
jgi:putative nucleotidyltransferase with HDIG domain